MKLKIVIFAVVVYGFAFTANALTPISPPPTNVVPLSQLVSEAYRYYKDVGVFSIKVPTVVEVPFVEQFIERYDFAVLDKTTDTFEPYYFKQQTIVNQIPLSISTNQGSKDANLMNDNNNRTYADFPLPENAQGYTQITLSSASPITSSALTVLLDYNVALPTSIEILAVVNGQNRIVFANTRMTHQTINFPQTTSNKWTISLTYGQPLRITELRLNQDNVTKSNLRAVRFLAQPDHSYKIYSDPDRPSHVPVGEAGNLSSVEDVFVAPSISSVKNPNYSIADTDGDGTPDITDNCVAMVNPGQLDVNNNGVGDVCEDYDKDRIVNSEDNCPNNPNANQSDVDNDGIGDVCDKEESRITERYAWVPWVGIGLAGLVLVVLVVLTAKRTHIKKPDDNGGASNS